MDVQAGKWITVGTSPRSERGVAVITRSPERARNYLARATPGRYMVVSAPQHLRGRQFGGMAWLDHEDPDPQLVEAAALAFLA